MPHSEADNADMTVESSPGRSSPATTPSAEHSIKEEGDGRKLDDIFNDDFDDVDMLDAGAEAELVKLEARTTKTEDGFEGITPELMRVFYQRLFPFKDLFLWLNHFPAATTSFTNREIAFTLQNGVYVRYNSFASHDALKQEVLKLNPQRFEIGPVYTANPRDRKSIRKAAFKPLEKELVFDIDMTDYDDVRTCCSGAAICNKCWKYITVAIEILDKTLRDDFGFKHILWVYSGRRGAHAWVCDKRARVLDDSRRRAIAAYLDVVRGGANAGKKVNVRRPLHPALARSLNTLRDRFGQIVLVEQDPWRGEDNIKRLLSLLPDRAFGVELAKQWEHDPQRPSLAKWRDMDELAEKGVSKTLTGKALREAKQDIVFEYLYPRLDAEVSKHLNHLLKSPFCVHPKTGRVCVTIDARDPGKFDPMAVPTVAQLLNEIDSYAGDDVPDFEKTSLAPYLRQFHSFVAGLMKDEMRDKRQRDKAAGEDLNF
ncbi:DNA primase small subunit [Dipodascopsis tothii]|uniref:DNA primase small subunit n=1 Tax=Dipodascopsis tothii TaxID=44089 RepID=UPI0034CDBB43